MINLGKKLDLASMTNYDFRIQGKLDDMFEVESQLPWDIKHETNARSVAQFIVAVASEMNSIIYV